MNVRDLIIEKTSIPMEIGSEVKDLIEEYSFNKEVFDEGFNKYPLYALLKIMAYTKRCAYILARRNMSNLCCGESARSNYIVYRSYMNEFKIAYDEFAKQFNDEELVGKLQEIRNKLKESIAVDYDDYICLMIDIFDTNSDLYSIEGIGYAR